MATIRRGRVLNKAIVWGDTQAIQEQEIIHTEPPEPPVSAKATIDSYRTPIHEGEPSRATRKITQGMPAKLRWQWEYPRGSGHWHTGAENLPGDVDHSFNQKNGNWDNVFPPGPGSFPIRLQCLDADGNVVDSSNPTTRVIEVQPAVIPPEPPEPGPLPPALELPDIHIDGVSFRTNAGLVHKIRGLTAFTAFSLWLDGNKSKLRSYADYTRSLGGNAWRIFGEWATVSFVAQQHPNYYDELPHFLTWVEDQGIRPWFVVFTSQGGTSACVMPPAQRQTHYAKVAQCLTGTLSILEQNNEDWKNGQICKTLPDPGTVLATRSAWQDQYDFYRQPGPIIDWTSEHTPRDNEWMRKAKNLLDTARLGFPEDTRPGHEHPSLAPTGCPPLAGEPIGIAELPVGGSRTNDARACADYYATAELMGAGAVLHGDINNLQTCSIPGPNAQRCAESVRDVWAAGIPGDLAQYGKYTRAGLSDCPLGNGSLTLRTYAMIRGNTAVAVVIQPKAGWTLQAVNGWHVVKVGGPQGQIVWLAR